MKLNQAKRTSTSPGPEPKLKLTPTGEKGADGEENKSSKSSPVEKEVDMSKSMPPIDLSKSLSSLSGKLKTPPNELDKVPTIRMKPPMPSAASNRQSLTPASHKEVPAVNRHTVNITTPVKELPAVKPTAPAPPKVSPLAPVPSKNPVTVQRSPMAEKTNDVKAGGDNQESASAHSPHKSYDELLERIQKLEATVERQNQAIEELRNKLQVETDMRMLLQENVTQSMQVKFGG